VAERNPTDQKVGGSNPFERAQLTGPLPASRGAFLIPLGATLGATGDISHRTEPGSSTRPPPVCHPPADARTRPS
jgi:hypothetical protein